MNIVKIGLGVAVGALVGGLSFYSYKKRNENLELNKKTQGLKAEVEDLSEEVEDLKSSIEDLKNENKKLMNEVADLIKSEVPPSEEKKEESAK